MDMVEREPGAIINLKVRLRERLRAQLEAAADSRGLSLNSEVVNRLDRSFRDGDIAIQALELAFGERTADLLLQVGKIMRDGGNVGIAVTGNTPQPDGWMANPIAYDMVARGLAQFVERLRPAGDRILPRNPKLDPGVPERRQDIAVTLADRLADAWEHQYGVAQKRAPARKRRDLVEA